MTDNEELLRRTDEYWRSGEGRARYDFTWSADVAPAASLAEALRVEPPDRERVDSFLARILAGNHPYQQAYLEGRRSGHYYVAAKNCAELKRGSDPGRKYAALRLYKLNERVVDGIFGPVHWFSIDRDELDKVVGIARFGAEEYPEALAYVATGLVGEFVCDRGLQWIFEIPDRHDLWSRFPPARLERVLQTMMHLVPSIDFQSHVETLCLLLWKADIGGSEAWKGVQGLRFRNSQAAHRVLQALFQVQLSESGDPYAQFKLRRELISVLDGMQKRIRVKAWRERAELLRRECRAGQLRGVLQWICEDESLLKYRDNPFASWKSETVRRMKRSAETLLSLPT
jgi:hypothetical protein